MDKPDRPYYATRGGGNYETIDVIEDFQLDFHKGNAVKYILRAGHKGAMANEKEDLQKAISYLRRRINLLDGKKEW